MRIFHIIFARGHNLVLAHGDIRPLDSIVDACTRAIQDDAEALQIAGKNVIDEYAKHMATAYDAFDITLTIEIEIEAAVGFAFRSRRGTDKPGGRAETSQASVSIDWSASAFSTCL